MRFVYFALAVALIPASTAAQDKQDKKEGTEQSSTVVLINGQPIKGKMLEIDGKHFVAIEDLAQTLRGTIAYGDGQILVTLTKLPANAAKAQLSQSSPAAPQALSSPVSPVTVQPLQSGSIKGTLTYFFDFHTGNKPDAGTKVWLFKGNAETPPNQNFVATNTALGTSANPMEYSVLQFSTADENGNFELLDVPASQYTLVIQSEHTKWTLNDKRNFFGRGNGHNPRDSDGRVEFLKLTVKPGEEADASKDFGPNIDN